MSATWQGPLPRVPLGRTGMHAAVLGMGCSPLGHSYGEADEQTVIDTVHAAFAAGINLFDTSPMYGAGRAEKLLGAALKCLPRDQLIVCTKVGKYTPGESPDYSAARVVASVYASLARLGLTHIDVLHVHNIEFCADMRQIVHETLPALADLKRQGLIRAIGITGYPLDIFTYILDRVPGGTVDVVLSYCHCSLHDTSLIELLPRLADKGVGVIGAAPLCMGLWRPQGPEAWHPAPAALKHAAKRCAQLAASAGVSLPRLAIKAAVAQAAGGVAVHLLGMAKPSEVADNVAVMREVVSGQQGAEPADAAPVGPAAAPSGDEGDASTPQQASAPAKPARSASTAGLSAAEEAVLAQIRSVLQPVQDVTWPVGRTDNRR